MAVFSGSMSEWQDTIVALATPPGVGALGVIRISGQDAFRIAGVLMPGKAVLTKAKPCLLVGWLKHNGVRIDEVVASLFEGPKSFTGEDVAEFSCHGSPYVLQQVIDAILAEGARLAKPGEFTQRAFLNGKMDLTQAEAVADVIASHSSAAHQAALHQMRGGFSTELDRLREALIRFSALIELELDFATEDVAFADRDALVTLINELDLEVSRLLGSFKLGNAIKQGVQVAIIGRPNAGKSTLLNTLLNENRAIVSDIAGTTRDTIEEVLNIDGILFRLIDTAGIRESSDEIESIGVEKSLEKMRRADIVVYLYDLHRESMEELVETRKLLDAEAKAYLMVANKTDLSKQQPTTSLPSGIDTLMISAKEGYHVDLLKEKLVDKVLQGSLQGEHTIVTNARHFAALQEVSKSLHDIQQALADEVPGDLMALDIRRCLQYLGEITGTITNEDQLDYIFSKFCIGK